MGGLGSLFEGEEQSRRGRPGWAVDRGFRKGLEKEPVQNLESDVVWELLSAASADGEDPESEWRGEDVGDSDGLRSNRANGREESAGSSGGSVILPASYGYRPGKPALDAVGQARQMCWAYNWVCDLDIKGFFGNLDHGLMMKAVRKHAQERWMVLYIERWLKAPAQDEQGNLLQRGYTFRPRVAYGRKGRIFCSFSPAISKKAEQKIRDEIRGWKLHRCTGQTIGDLARKINPELRGWFNYYGRFTPSALRPIERHVGQSLVRWVCRKYKKLRKPRSRAWAWLIGVLNRQPNLLALWEHQRSRFITIGAV